MKLAYFALSMLALCSSQLTCISAASAQDQTPENAQRFLAIVFQNAILHDRRLNAVPAYETRQSISALRMRGQKFSLQSYTSAATCQGVFQVSGDDVRYTIYSDPIDLRGGPSMTSSVRMAGQRALTIDWRTVASARAEGNTVYFSTSEAPSKEYWPELQGVTDSRMIEIVLPDPDLATRAAFALQVIRLHCDPAARTGF